MRPRRCHSGINGNSGSFLRAFEVYDSRTNAPPEAKKKDHFSTLFLDVAVRRASFADKEDADFSLRGSALHKASLVCTDGSCTRSFLKTGQVYLYGTLDTRGARDKKGLNEEFSNSDLKGRQQRCGADSSASWTVWAAHHQRAASDGEEGFFTQDPCTGSHSQMGTALLIPSLKRC